MSAEIDRLVEDGEVTEELPGEWGPNYWLPPANGYAPSAREVMGLLRGIINSKRKRQNEIDRLWWYTGDLINYAGKRYGDEFYQLVQGSDYHEESFASASRIAEAFEPERRWAPEEVGFWQHGVVKPLKAPVADKLLKRYADRHKPEAEQVGAESPDERTLQNRTDLRQEVRGIRMLTDGEQDAPDALPELHDCPYCAGVGKVTELARRGYYEERGEAI